jgi:hypothetical protein
MDLKAALVVAAAVVVIPSLKLVLLVVFVALCPTLTLLRGLDLDALKCLH